MTLEPEQQSCINCEHLTMSVPYNNAVRLQCYMQNLDSTMSDVNDGYAPYQTIEGGMRAFCNNGINCRSFRNAND